MSNLLTLTCKCHYLQCLVYRQQTLYPNTKETPITNFDQSTLATHLTGTKQLMLPKFIISIESTELGVYRSINSLTEGSD